MLDQVVLVRGLEDVTDHSKRPDFAAAIRRDEPGDLEINQVRKSVVAQEDVLSLFQIDIGGATGMDGVDEGRQLREKLIADGVFLLQRPSLDVVVEDACRAKPTTKRRDSRDAPHQMEESGLVVGQESAGPQHGKSEECRSPANFDHDLVCLSLIKSRDGEKIMFERFNKTELSTFNIQNCREVVSA